MSYEVQLSTGLATVPDNLTEQDIAALNTALRIKAGLPAMVPVHASPRAEATQKAIDFVWGRMAGGRQAWLRPSVHVLWAWRGDPETLEASITELVKQGRIKCTGNMIEWIPKNEDDS